MISDSVAEISKLEMFKLEMFKVEMFKLEMKKCSIWMALVGHRSCVHDEEHEVKQLLKV